MAATAAAAAAVAARAHTQVLGLDHGHRGQRSDIEESKHTHGPASAVACTWPRSCARGTMRRAVRKSSGVWVCMAPRKEKSAQENEVERGCVGSLRSRARGTRSDQEAR